MITVHFFFEERGTGFGTWFLASMIGIGAVLVSVRADGVATALSDAASRRPCVTLPTVAWPPSPTVKWCTVNFCFPAARNSFCASIWVAYVRSILLNKRSDLSVFGI